MRDLASGQQLLWLPLREASTLAVAEALASLFAIHSAPWVIKSDNGKVFAAPAVASLLRQFGVLGLFSPPRTPSYNGAIEAGIGALKTRSEAHAARAGHAGHWSWDDAEAARLEANATARPHGLSEPTPDQIWAARASIGINERLSFGQQVEVHRCSVRSEWNLLTDSLGVMTERAIDRVAIRRALVEHGVLTFTRKSIPPTIPRRKADSVS